MKGKYHVIVQNNRIKFEFEICRNITIIRGDSATGKTTLMTMIENHENLGDDSGVTISCARKCKTINNSNWETVIDDSKECIIFADENVRAMKTEEFARKISESSNYYVLITRENLPNLPYSVEEIYGIHSSGKYMTTRQTYNSFYRLYSPENMIPDEKVDTVLVEDTNAGFEFFDAVSSESVNCISAGGKSGIIKLLREYSKDRIMIIADGAAFGAEMSEVFLYMKTHKDIYLYLPESFEWIVLSSGLIDGKRVSEIVEHTEEYVESSEYFSWEQYYTSLLVSETKGTYYQYSKKMLNRVYLQEKEIAALKKVIAVVSGCI